MEIFFVQGKVLARLRGLNHEDIYFRLVHSSFAVRRLNSIWNELLDCNCVNNTSRYCTSLCYSVFCYDCIEWLFKKCDALYETNIERLFRGIAILRLDSYSLFYYKLLDIPFNYYYWNWSQVCNFVSYVVAPASCNGCLEATCYPHSLHDSADGQETSIDQWMVWPPSMRSSIYLSWREIKARAPGWVLRVGCLQPFSALREGCCRYDLSLRREFSYGRDIDIVALALG